MIRDLSKQNRSYTCFNQSAAVPYELLESLVDAARYAPSCLNIQPLRYVISCTERKNQKIFPAINWNVLLRGYDGPREGQKPMAYIVLIADKGLMPEDEMMWIDIGISAQTMMLAAVEQGLGGCMIANFDKAALARELRLEKWYDPVLILALGKPNESIFLDYISRTDATEFYRDREGYLHIPKRRLEDVILPFEPKD